MMHDRLTCRLCGGIVKPVFALSPTPIANAFPGTPDRDAERYRLELAQCRDCTHVQVRDVIPDAVLYADYRYETPSALAAGLVASAHRLRAAYPNARRVLEIGSNNGLFLDALRGAGFDAFGVDPAASKSDYAIRAAFSNKLAWMLGEFDLVLANNAFAHIDDLNDVFLGVKKVLADKGALIFEVQYLPALITTGAFDMIYHEHRDYHTVAPLKPFLRRFGLVMTGSELIGAHGGSLRVTASRTGEEFSMPEDARIDWSSFAERINAAKASLREQMGDDRIIAFGATAKACTLIHHYGLQDRIEYCVDSTPAKQGRYIAGTNIKIFPVETLYQSKSARRILLTAWNHAAIIKKQHPDLDYIEPFKELA